MSTQFTRWWQAGHRVKRNKARRALPLANLVVLVGRAHAFGWATRGCAPGRPPGRPLEAPSGVDPSTPAAGFLGRLKSLELKGSKV